MLETKRLFLRKYQETDVNDYYEYMSQKEIGSVLGFPPYTNIESARERLIKEMQRDTFAIVYKDNNKVIGHVSLFDVKVERYKGINIGENAIEMGFLLSRDYWGKAIMPEALTALIDYIFEKTSNIEVVLGHKITNKQSESVQNKLGFKVVAEIVDENNIPYIARKITKQEWFENKHKNKI